MKDDKEHTVLSHRKNWRHRTRLAVAR